MEDDLAASALKLSEWAKMAARSFGIYAGINAAIGAAVDKSTPAVNHANEIRQQVALMAAIRAFALLDRSADISLQRVYQLLKRTDAVEIVAGLYAAADPVWPIESAKKECSQFRQRFLNEYEAVNWDAFSRLQSFRNTALAHVGIEITKFIRYQELELIIRNCARLSGEFTLMTTGLNEWPEEEVDEHQEAMLRFWSEIFLADSEDRLAYGHQLAREQ